MFKRNKIKIVAMNDKFQSSKATVKLPVWIGVPAAYEFYKLALKRKHRRLAR